MYDQPIFRYLEDLDLAGGAVDELGILLVRLPCLHLQAERHALLTAVLLCRELRTDAVYLEIHVMGIALP